MYQYQNPYLYNYQPQPQIQPQPTLPGKVVGSIDEARVVDVPVGTIAYFPKGDGSEVYLKGWRADGTTYVDIYQKVVEVKPAENADTTTLDDIYNSIQSLSKKIDGIKPSSTAYPINKKKKVGDEDE